MIRVNYIYINSELGRVCFVKNLNYMEFYDGDLVIQVRVVLMVLLLHGIQGECRLESRNLV